MAELELAQCKLFGNQRAILVYDDTTLQALEIRHEGQGRSQLKVKVHSRARRLAADQLNGNKFFRGPVLDLRGEKIILVKDRFGVPQFPDSLTFSFYWSAA